MIFALMDNKPQIAIINKLMPFLIYKNFFFIKYFNTNFFLLNNSINLFQGFNKNMILIKRNKKKLLSYLLSFKRNFTIYKFVFKGKLRFNHFLLLMNLKKHSKNNIKTSSNISSSLIPFFGKNFFSRNWFYLVGGMVSPFFWDLQNQKKLTKQNSFNVMKKYSSKPSFFTKKIYLYNFFYFSNAHKTSKVSNFLLKINLYSYRNHSNHLIKFNLFFNSSYYFKKNYIYAKVFIAALYKNYVKIFNSFKRNNFKYKM
jgi:hypothetical protein